MRHLVVRGRIQEAVLIAAPRATPAPYTIMSVCIPRRETLRTQQYVTVYMSLVES